jgi:hypothetical protein
MKSLTQEDVIACAITVNSVSGQLRIDLQHPWEIGVSGGNLAMTKLLPRDVNGKYDPMEDSAILLCPRVSFSG